MRKLKLPRESAIESYDGIVAAKQHRRREILQGLRASVSERYEFYRRAAPHLGVLTGASFSEEEFEALNHCYEVETAPLDVLKSAIKQHQEPHQQSSCAYCGINNPRTIEHYVPRSEHPEYAVCAYNLLPACDECNNTKGTQWRDPESGERRQLHFYYDAIPEDVRWLVARIEVDRGTPLAVFSLDLPESLEPALSRLIQAHYHSLKLLERYGGCANGLLSELLSNVSCYPLEREPLRRQLNESARRLARKYGENFWRVATLRGAAASDAFLDMVFAANTASGLSGAA